MDLVHFSRRHRLACAGPWRIIGTCSIDPFYARHFLDFLKTTEAAGIFSG